MVIEFLWELDGKVCYGRLTTLMDPAKDIPVSIPFAVPSHSDFWLDHVAFFG